MMYCYLNVHFQGQRVKGNKDEIQNLMFNPFYIILKFYESNFIDKEEDISARQLYCSKL